MTSQRASSCLAPTFLGRERVPCASLFLLCPLDRCERNAKAGPPRQHVGPCVRLSPCDHADHIKVFSCSRGRHVLPVPLARSFVDAEIDLTGRSLPLEGGELLFGDGSAHARPVRGVIYMLSTYFSRRRSRCAAPPLLLTLLRCFCADALGRPRFISRLSHPFLPRFSLSLFRAVPREIRSPCTGASPKRLAGEQRKTWPLPRSGGSCPPLGVRKHVFAFVLLPDWRALWCGNPKRWTPRDGVWVRTYIVHHRRL